MYMGKKKGVGCDLRSIWFPSFALSDRYFETTHLFNFLLKIFVLINNNVKQNNAFVLGLCYVITTFFFFCSLSMKFRDVRDAEKIKNDLLGIQLYKLQIET